MITFYTRGTEIPFTTDPDAVVSGFLSSPMSRKIRSAAEHPDPRRRAFVLRHLDGPLSLYLQLKGAQWEKPGNPDPHGTRAAYDLVYRLTRNRLTPPPQP